MSIYIIHYHLPGACVLPAGASRSIPLHRRPVGAGPARPSPPGMAKRALLHEPPLLASGDLDRP
ncbi:MAG TPA: hypothetical protein PKW32_15175 [Verrucomicrobiota bacterium]|nr:hypothetical protein [Verrucomicrobiota bacterium]